MINLYVKPLDMAAEGSFQQRSDMIDAFCALEEATESGKWRDWRAAQQKVLELVRPHLRVEGEGTVDEALAKLSANKFDELFRALIGGSGDAVPPVSDSNSTDG